MLVACSTEAGPGVRYAAGELGITEICWQAKQLCLRGTKLQALGSPQPQFIQRGLECLPHQKGGRARPDSGCHRIRALEEIARRTDQLRLVRTHDSSRILAESF